MPLGNGRLNREPRRHVASDAQLDLPVHEVSATRGAHTVKPALKQASYGRIIADRSAGRRLHVATDQIRRLADA